MAPAENKIVSAKRKLPRCLRALAGENGARDVVFVPGARHWKITVNGTFAGIYPLAPAKEGFAENAKSQLRRAGLKVPR